MFGLADCNSFFASCERVFRPDLRCTPIVVLSNNDGCVVALTKEAKALGIHRGDPIFKLKDVVESENVAVFSSNYALYADLSSRVMHVLADTVGDIDIYSIDEAPTLTLAKVANNFAKKYDGYKGVCFIDDDEKRIKALQLLPIEDVWGVGRHNVERLKVCGIRTAFDLTRKNELWINKMLNINGVRMWKELKGESCIGVNELPGKKSICTSRSFGNLISDWDNLCESVVNFVVSCAEKLRRQHSVCKILTVFIMTSRFRADLPQYNNSVNIALPVATADTSELVKYAVLGLRSIYKGGYLYKKSGVVVSGISSDSAIEQDLFDFVDRSKQRSIINAIDTINSKHSKGALSLASQGVTQGHWGLKREYFSRCYSTNFNDIIGVKI